MAFAFIDIVQLRKDLADWKISKEEFDTYRKQSVENETILRWTINKLDNLYKEWKIKKDNYENYIKRLEAYSLAQNKWVWKRNWASQVNKDTWKIVNEVNWISNTNNWGYSIWKSVKKNEISINNLSSNTDTNNNTWDYSIWTSVKKTNAPTNEVVKPTSVVTNTDINTATNETVNTNKSVNTNYSKPKNNNVVNNNTNEVNNNQSQKPEQTQVSTIDKNRIKNDLQWIGKYASILRDKTSLQKKWLSEEEIKTLWSVMWGTMQDVNTNEQAINNIKNYAEWWQKNYQNIIDNISNNLWTANYLWDAEISKNNLKSNIESYNKAIEAWDMNKARQYAQMAQWKFLEYTWQQSREDITKSKRIWMMLDKEMWRWNFNSTLSADEQNIKDTIWWIVNKLKKSKTNI